MKIGHSKKFIYSITKVYIYRHCHVNILNKEFRMVKGLLKVQNMYLPQIPYLQTDKKRKGKINLFY